jgi:hypothetical protein
VLVHVREPGILGALGERAILHIDFDGGQRNAVVLDHDHFEAVRSTFRLMILSSSARCAKTIEGSQNESQCEASSEPGKTAISLWHVVNKNLDD